MKIEHLHSNASKRLLALEEQIQHEQDVIDYLNKADSELSFHDRELFNNVLKYHIQKHDELRNILSENTNI